MTIYRDTQLYYPIGALTVRARRHGPPIPPEQLPRHCEAGKAARPGQEPVTTGMPPPAHATAAAPAALRLG